MKRHVIRIIRTVLGVSLILLAILTGWMPVFQFWIPLILGLALLAPEYKWAHDLKVKAIEMKNRAMDRLRARRSKKKKKPVEDEV